MKNCFYPGHVFVVLLLLLGLSACEDLPDKQRDRSIVTDFSSFERPLQCRIISFTVDPPHGSHGDNFTFSWETEHAKGVDIEPGIGQGLPVNGSLTVPLYESNWIKLIARGPGGPVESKLWVEVTWPGGSTWSRNYANELNNCQSPYEGPTSGHLFWSHDFDQDLYNSPLIGEDGSVFVFSHTTLHCLSSQGYSKWSYKDLDSLQSIAVNSHGDIYVSGFNEYHSVLVKLHPNGSELWRFDFTDQNFGTSAMLLQPQGLISLWTTTSYGCSGYDGNTFIMDQNGNLELQFEHEGYYPNPSILLNTYFVYSGSGRLYNLNFEGYQLWENSGVYYGNYLSTTSAGSIYIPAITPDPYDVALTAIDATGEALWSFDDFTDIGSLFNHPVATDNQGNIYFTAQYSEDEQFCLFSLNSSGNLRWQYFLNEDEIYSTSLAVDGTGNVYLILRQRVLAVSQDGIFLWEYALPNTNYNSMCSLSMDGTLYVIGKKQLLAFRDKEEDVG